MILDLFVSISWKNSGFENLFHNFIILTVWVSESVHTIFGEKGMSCQCDTPSHIQSVRKRGKICDTFKYIQLGPVETCRIVYHNLMELVH